MNSVLDELRVIDEDGQIHITVIPSDAVSPEPSIQHVFVKDSPGWFLVREFFLARIACAIGQGIRIVGIVHGGDDRYTLITSEEAFVEVACGTHPEVLQDIQRIGDLAETSCFPNAFPASPPSPRGVHLQTGVNRLPRAGVPLRIKWETVPARDEGFPWINPSPRTLCPGFPGFPIPNRMLRSAS